MRVLLINPPVTVFGKKEFWFPIPLSLAYLAAVLEQAGHEVSILDAAMESTRLENLGNDLYRVGMSNEELTKEIARKEPDLVGITCLSTPRFPNVVEITRIVKKLDSSIPTVVGGAFPSSSPEFILKTPSIDYVLVGEGEYPLLELVNSLENKTKVFSQIDGLGFKKNGSIFMNPKIHFVDDLDSIPFPSRHLLNIEKYVGNPRIGYGKKKRQTSIISSRSCPFRCTFCGIQKVWGTKWRARSPKNVVDELEHCITKYNITEFSFEDDNFSTDRKRAEAICKEIKLRKLDITWNSPNGLHVNTLNADLLKKMRDAGFYACGLGIESGDPHILHDVMIKNISLKRIRKTVSEFASLGIFVLGYFVIGMPGETRESIMRTIKFAKSLDLKEIGVAIATPFPGTLLYEDCVAKGYMKPIELFSEVEMTMMGGSYPFLDTPDMKAKDLTGYVSLFYRDFYKAKVLQNPLTYMKEIMKRPQMVTKYLQNTFETLRAQNSNA